MEPTAERSVVLRRLDRDADAPGAELAAIVAELDGRDPTELPDMWSCVDDVVDHVLSDPPSPEAGVQVTFEYQGYRVTVHHDGSTTLVPRR